MNKMFGIVAYGIDDLSIWSKLLFMYNINYMIESDTDDEELYFKIYIGMENKHKYDELQRQHDILKATEKYFV